MAPMSLPDGYAPTVGEVEDMLLPRTRTLLEAIDAVPLDWLGELIRENPPWPFYDPSLRAFGRGWRRERVRAARLCTTTRSR